jgi:hypothetical protein
VIAKGKFHNLNLLPTAAEVWNVSSAVLLSAAALARHQTGPGRVSVGVNSDL